MATDRRDGAITIEYCGTCNYRPLAASLAFSIKAATGLAARLVHSEDAGAFEVLLDGERIFSKQRAGRFPDHGPIVEAVRKRLGNPA